MYKQIIYCFLENKYNWYDKEDYLHELYCNIIDKITPQQQSDFYSYLILNKHSSLISYNIDNLVFIIKYDFNEEIINFYIKCMCYNGTYLDLIKYSIYLIARDFKYI